MKSRHDPAIELDGSVWMTLGGESLGGAGRITLLAAIAECGSITKAAKAVKMSYKAAWDAVDAMNNLAGEPLVERVSGGKGGGGTRLTRRGAQLVENFQLIEREHRHFIEQLSRQAEGIADDFLLLRRISMKTSARNQFLGTVAQVKRGAVNDEIELDLTGGQKIVATITHESTADLGLQTGAQAYAMVKASSIILVIADDNAKFSARNRMPGIVSRVQTGAVNTEVVIDLDGGGALAAIITNESCIALELVVGARAAGMFNASSVILAVPS
ncbi:MAG: TOBE domain-containing protein [Pseudomonadota bacterium]|nr:TOBE domain-containing protein [Pseudomonadota bacterium]